MSSSGHGPVLDPSLVCLWTSTRRRGPLGVSLPTPTTPFRPHSPRSGVPGSLLPHVVSQAPSATDVGGSPTPHGSSSSVRQWTRAGGGCVLEERRHLEPAVSRVRVVPATSPRVEGAAGPVTDAGSAGWTPGEGVWEAVGREWVGRLEAGPPTAVVEEGSLLRQWEGLLPARGSLVEGRRPGRGFREAPERREEGRDTDTWGRDAPRGSPHGPGVDATRGVPAR